MLPNRNLLTRKDLLAGGWRILLAGLVLTGSPRRQTKAQAMRHGMQHGIAMHGEPALAEGFTHLPYAEPAAPKQGHFVQGILGTFDSLNPLIVKGIAPSYIRGYVVESLMARGYNEPFTLYGLLAEAVETDEDRTFVTFRINPAARFSDGKAVTPEDVVFS
jgi:peptide/nickel transport system substrate-binding protein